MFLRSWWDDLPLDSGRKKLAPPKKIRMDKRASFMAVRDPIKAIQVELPHKRREMSLVKVVGSNIFHKGVGIVNLECFSIRREGYDVAISSTFHVGQKTVQLTGKRLFLSLPTRGRSSRTRSSCRLSRSVRRHGCIFCDTKKPEDGCRRAPLCHFVVVGGNTADAPY
jgi:hypothetical protein